MKEIVFVESNASGHGLRAIGVAKQLGLSVTFLAIDPNLFRSGSNDPLAIVDRLEVVDTYDVDAMMKVVNPENTVGIVAWDDYHLNPAAELANRLGLPSPSVEGIDRARLKDRARLRLQELGEQRPRFAVLTEEDSREESPIGYPCVVKPVDDSGSVGVKICKDAAEFRDAMQFLEARSKNVRGYSLSRRWLVEEYVEGPEFSAEVLYIKGEWHLIGVTKKLLTPPPYFVEVGHVFPVELPADTYEQIRGKVISWLDGIGLQTGAAHVEFRLTDEGPVLMEINPRLGGDMIPELIRQVYGIDVVEYLLKLAVGEADDLDASDFKPQGAAAIRFLIADGEGEVDGIAGAEEVRALPFVKDCQLKQGRLNLKAATSSYDRFGHVIVKSDSAAEAERDVAEALSKLRFVQEVSR